MKIVLITGATSGFGMGLVKGLLAEGHQVIATGRNLTERSDLFAPERIRYPNLLTELNLDVTAADERRAVSHYLENKTLDVLVNNAGFAVFGSAEECTEDQLRKQFEVNFFGLVLLTKELLPFIRKSKGHIINFSSVFGMMGFPLSSTYCASKFAVEGYSESLSYELASHFVKVTLVEPGGYRTNFNKAAEWGSTTIPEFSAYTKQTKNYAKFRAKLAARPNPPDPKVVIEGVIRIIKINHPKINYTFGLDATLVRIMKKAIPRSLFHRISTRLLNRMMTKELE